MYLLFLRCYSYSSIIFFLCFMLLPIFRPPHKQKTIQKIFEENKNYISEKNAPECLGNCQRLVEED